MTKVSHERLGVSFHVAIVGERAEQAFAFSNAVECPAGLGCDLRDGIDSLRDLLEGWAQLADFRRCLAKGPFGGFCGAIKTGHRILSTGDEGLDL